VGCQSTCTPGFLSLHWSSLAKFLIESREHKRECHAIRNPCRIFLAFIVSLPFDKCHRPQGPRDPSFDGDDTLTS
jgi:hypothetical protein